jgi:3,4-dihydroxy 2-butanone 4-phosphate synthase/GTP cyclohydrolase II
MPHTEDAIRRTEAAIAEIRAGRMVIVADDEDRENEGDLVMAADAVTAEAVNFMVRHGRGLVCVPLLPERCDELDLPPMAAHNTAPRGTAFTVSVEAKVGVSTGISAADRAVTIRTLCDPAATAADLVRPGHIFPLRASPGGVLQRTGQTEAAIDLARLAGRHPSGVICEIMNEDGSMARRPDLDRFAAEHGLVFVTVADLVRYRLAKERLVVRLAQPRLPTAQGDWTIIVYGTDVDDKNHLALVMGEIGPDDEVLVRVHSECLTGDVFGSVRCDCGRQLEAAMERIAREGKGVVVYLRQEGRGIGLVEKLRAYELQESKGLDTVEANQRLGHLPDKRDYGIGAQILRDVGVRKIRYLTNNPQKFVALRGYDLEIVERVPLQVKTDERTLPYLRTKRDKMGHLLEDI